MKAFLTTIFVLILSTGFTQGLEETFDAGCNCWIITNHYDNGVVSMVHHENEARQKHGEMRHYNTEGKLTKVESWSNGKLHGTSIHYHPDGSVYLEATFNNGKKMGTWIFRDPDGTPSQEISYSGKGADGVYVHYHAGVPYVEQVIEEGKMINTRILNQEIYDVVQEEAAAIKKP